MTTTNSLDVMNFTVTGGEVHANTIDGVAKLVAEKHISAWSALVVRGCNDVQVLNDIEAYFDKRHYNITPLADEMVEQTRTALVKAYTDEAFAFGTGKSIVHVNNCVDTWREMKHCNFASAWECINTISDDHITRETVDAIREQYVFTLVAMYVGDVIVEQMWSHGKDLSQADDYIEYMTFMAEPDLYHMRRKIRDAINTAMIVNTLLMMKQVAAELELVA